jgi:uncharacterized membrane protein YfhO
MYLKWNIAQIIITPMNMTSEYKITKSSLPEYFYQIKYSDYMDVINAQKDYLFYDCSYSTNNYTFKTNYDSRRMIVLQVPYDKGWKCVATDANGNTKDLKVYKADGGFNCVMGEIGETTYSFQFKTHLFDAGLAISIGSAASLVVIGLYWGVVRKKQDAIVPQRKIIVKKK